MGGARACATFFLLAFQSAWPGPEVGFGEVAIDLLQARLNEALAADAFACSVSAVVCERIRLGHKEITYDPPSQNDARRTRAS